MMQDQWASQPPQAASWAPAGGWAAPGPQPGAPAPAVPHVVLPGFPGPATSPLAFAAVLSAAASFIVVPFLGGLAAIVLGALGVRQVRATRAHGALLAWSAVALGVLNVVVTLVVAIEFVALISETVASSVPNPS